jgi:hypothetical protein
MDRMNNLTAEQIFGEFLALKEENENLKMLIQKMFNGLTETTSDIIANLQAENERLRDGR